MRYFLIIMLLLPVVCWADHGHGQYCITGTIFLPNHNPLRNRTFVITGSDFGPQNVETDSNGKFKVIITYFIACRSGTHPRGIDYLKKMNPDSLEIIYHSFSVKYTNPWITSYNDSIHRYYLGTNKNAFPEWRTSHFDIILSENWTLSKDERWNIATSIRKLSKIDPDSLQNSDRYKYYRPTQKAYHIPAFIDSYQPVGKPIREFKSLTIWCPSLFTWKYSERTREYRLTTLMAPGYTKVLRTDAADKIIESQDEWDGDPPHQSY